MRLLCMHNVISGSPDVFDRKCSRISAAEFESFLERASKKFRLVSFSEYMDLIRKKLPDPNAIALSFDDGFLGVYEEAFPVLKKRGLDAIVFVNPPFLSPSHAPIFHFLEIEIMFRLAQHKAFHFYGDDLALGSPEERVKSMKTVKRKLKTVSDADRARIHAEMMKSLGVTQDQLRAHAETDKKFQVMKRDDVRALQKAGWAIGAHTLSHRSLAWLDEKEAESEIMGSKKELESVLGTSCDLFAYPYGEEVHVGKVAPKICANARFSYSFTTIPGENGTETNPQLMHRYDYKDFCRVYLP